jgi:hypothetical protein
MTELFDYLNSINYDKKNIMLDEIDEKKYIPFVINMCLSRNQDCVIIVNELNLKSFIPVKAQYQFLLNTISKKKRYTKKIESDQDINIEMVMEYFKINRLRAKEYLKLLNEETLNKISIKMNKGGLMTKRGKKK